MAAADPVATLATFGTVWAVLAVGHNFADHMLGQTDRLLEHTGSGPFSRFASGGINGMYLADLLCTNGLQVGVYKSVEYNGIPSESVGR